MESEIWIISTRGRGRQSYQNYVRPMSQFFKSVGQQGYWLLRQNSIRRATFFSQRWWEFHFSAPNLLSLWELHPKYLLSAYQWHLSASKRPVRDKASKWHWKRKRLEALYLTDTKVRDGSLSANPTPSFRSWMNLSKDVKLIITSNNNKNSDNDQGRDKGEAHGPWK